MASSSLFLICRIIEQNLKGPLVRIEQLRRSTITIAECEATMERIRAGLSNELLRLPANLSRDLSNRDPQYIQQALEVAFRSALERLRGQKIISIQIYGRPEGIRLRSLGFEIANWMVR